MTELPDAEWLHDAGLNRVVAALQHDVGPPRIVGGAVRDALLGIAVADVDLATRLLPPEVTARLQRDGIKAIPTGIDHGTITAVASGRTYEITTLRRDVSTDGRRATVAFSTDWREDAARRDFTINALYVDPLTRQIYDYFGGLADLDKRQVRFIGEAAARIAEDHLRILRLFRFHARFGEGEIDAEALAAATAQASSLMALSRERIADELLKLLSVANPVAAIEIMITAGIFAPFLPEVMIASPDILPRLVQREQQAGVPSSSLRRLAALLPTDVPHAEKIAARLKLSNRMRSELAILADPTRSNVDARTLAYDMGIDGARDYILLRADDDQWAPGLAQLADWTVPTLPIKGGDLIAKGLAAGAIVAQTLQAIERQWVDEGFPPHTRVNEIADQMVSVAVRDARKS